MAVAWVGQIRFAMTVMGWPLPAAIVFAAGFELSTAYVARLDWLARAAGDSALLFRTATWGFAAGAALMNYWHAAGPDFAPTGEAVSYGLMSVTGVVLWELLSTYRHRTALRAEGKRPAARPRFGLARWIWFGKLTRLAWLLTLRDGYTTTDLAWRAALGAVDLYGSARDARKAVRAGRPVSRPESLDANQRDDADKSMDGRDAEAPVDQRDVQRQYEDRDVSQQYLQRDITAPDEQRDVQTRHEDRDSTERYLRRDTTADTTDPAGHDVGERAANACGTESNVASRDEAPTPQLDHEPDDHDEANDAAPDPNPDRGGDQDPAAQDQRHADERDGEPDDRDETNDVGPGGSWSRREGRQGTGEGAVGSRMLTYARERLAQGVSVTGAELDREFGTRDYGRKVLRRLAAESPTSAI